MMLATFNWNDSYPIFAHPAFDVQWFQKGDLCVAFLLREKLGIKRLILFSEVFSQSGKTVSPVDEGVFFLQLLEAAKKNGVHLIAQPHPQALPQAAPEASSKIPFGSYRLNLMRGNEEELFAHCHSKHRNSIRKAEKDGVTIAIGIEHLDRAVVTVNQTMQRQNMPLLENNYFKNLAEKIGSKMFVAVAELNNEAQAACILFWSQYSAYYSYGGTIDKPTSGAMNYLLWSAAMHLKNHGCKRFDFVGARIEPDPNSKYAGIQAFKERFGGELARGYLWKMPLKNPQAKTFSLLEKCVAYLRHAEFKGDIIDQELRRTKA